MSDPWFEPNTFGAYAGAILGGGGGSLVGLWGALAGTLGPRGKAKGLVLSIGAFIVVAAAIIAGIGVYAWLDGQPYGIWYPLVLSGSIMGLITAGLLPLIVRRYGEADTRRLAAEQFRGR